MMRKRIVSPKFFKYTAATNVIICVCARVREVERRVGRGELYEYG